MKHLHHVQLSTVPCFQYGIDTLNFFMKIVGDVEVGELLSPVQRCGRRRIGGVLVLVQILMLLLVVGLFLLIVRVVSLLCVLLSYRHFRLLHSGRPGEARRRLALAMSAATSWLLPRGDGGGARLSHYRRARRCRVTRHSVRAREIRKSRDGTLLVLLLLRLVVLALSPLGGGGLGVLGDIHVFRMITALSKHLLQTEGPGFHNLKCRSALGELVGVDEMVVSLVGRAQKPLIRQLTLLGGQGRCVAAEDGELHIVVVAIIVVMIVWLIRCGVHFSRTGEAVAAACLGVVAIDAHGIDHMRGRGAVSRLRLLDNSPSTDLERSTLEEVSNLVKLHAVLSVDDGQQETPALLLHHSQLQAPHNLQHVLGVRQRKLQGLSVHIIQYRSELLRRKHIQ
mmetsp:Transcript_37627/g.70090  ORF Transcript_37627/g.70090 Transcript_37627/m.70090 type:complete len:395 (-) Transcript_37627:344-1528(-)